MKAKPQHDKSLGASDGFYLVDSRGVTRARLGFLTEDGCPSLEFFDKKGLQRLRLMVDERGSPSVSLHREDASEAVTIQLAPDGRVGVGVMGSEGSTGIFALIHPDGSPQIDVYDKDAKCLWSSAENSTQA